MNTDISDVVIGNVTNTGSNGIARAVFCNAAGNSFVRDGAIGTVSAFDTGGRARGVCFTSNGGLFEEDESSKRCSRDVR